MDWAAVALSIKLGLVTLLLLLPFCLWLSRWIAFHARGSKPWIEGLIALPLILPPTVVGYYLLVLMGRESVAGSIFESVFGHSLAFSFEGLVVGSLVFNLPFAVQPMQRAYEAISHDLREAALCCGLGGWEIFFRIELPLIWPGVISAAIMTFAHTIGEFGIVLMIGGNIKGETQTISVAIYDEIQSLNFDAANNMSFLLLCFSLVTIVVTYWLSGKLFHRK